MRRCHIGDVAPPQAGAGQGGCRAPLREPSARERGRRGGTLRPETRGEYHCIPPGSSHRLVAVEPWSRVRIRRGGHRGLRLVVKAGVRRRIGRVAMRIRDTSSHSADGVPPDVESQRAPLQVLGAEWAPRQAGAGRGGGGATTRLRSDHGHGRRCFTPRPETCGEHRCTPPGSGPPPRKRGRL